MIVDVKQSVRTRLSGLSCKLNLKSGSATHSPSGGRHANLPFFTLFCVDDVHVGTCLLYAMLILQASPMPVVEETEEQVVKIISIVPSRSTSFDVFRTSDMARRTNCRTNVTKGDALCASGKVAHGGKCEPCVLVINPYLIVLVSIAAIRTHEEKVCSARVSMRDVRHL